MSRQLRRTAAVVAAMLCLPLLPATAASAAPTPPTVGPNVNVTQRAGNQTEGSVAVDPTNTQRVFVASNDETQALAGVFSARSTDGGATWTAQNLGTGAGGDGFPAACCDPSASWDEFGNLFFVYLAIGPPRQVVLLVSTDGGATFAQAAILDTANGLDQPTVTTGAGSVWVSWRDNAGTLSARGATVTGLGAGNIGAFTAAQVAPTSNGGNFGDIAIGDAGQVLITYQIPSGGEGPSTIFTNLDADGVGAGVFGARTTATTTNVGGFDFLPAQPDRSVDSEAGLVYDRTGGANDGRVYLVYTEETTNENNDTDILVRFSDDDGANWSVPVQANDDTGTNSQFLPRISLDQSTGNLAVTWHDARSDTETGGDGPNNDAQFWGTFSLDGGATFIPNLQISAGTSDEDGAEPPAACCADIDYGDYTGNSFAGGRMHAVWADNSNSTGNNPDGTLTRFDIYTSLVTPPIPNQPPVVDAGPPVSGDEGTPIALDGTVSDPDDPSPATTWSVTPGAGVDPGATCTFANPNAVDTTITCTDDGTFTATLTADDGFGGVASDSTTVTVANVAPVASVSSPTPGQLFEANTPVPVTAPFTDPGTNDTHTCSVTFGDGSPVVAGTVTESGGAGTCTASHVYPVTALGPRTITVTVTDDDGGSGNAQVNVVIFLPGAAFAIEATGLVNVPRIPDVTCPPNESQSIARLNVGVGTINGLNASCTLDPATGTTVATSSVGDARLLGGLITITAIESRCEASAAGIVRSSRVGTINGIPIGTGPGSINIGLATVFFNETTTNADGEFVQNAIRVRVPPILLIPGQEIILAGCRLG